MNSAAYEDEEDFVDDGEHLLPSFTIPHLLLQ